MGLALLASRCYMSSAAGYHEREDAAPRDAATDPDGVADPELEAPADTTWLLRIGGGRYEDTFSIVETRDGGLVAAGKTTSYGPGESAIWIVKVAAGGQVLWQASLGGSAYELDPVVVECRNGDLLLAGQTLSFGAGEDDILLARLGEDGRILWQEAIGGPLHDYARSIVEGSDGNIVIAGGSDSWGAGGGGFDAFVARLDGEGTLLWQKLLGGSASDGVQAVVETMDAGIILTGTTESFGAGASDLWVVRMDAGGGVVWEESIGTGEDDYGTSLVERGDGTLAVGGGTMAYDENGGLVLLELDGGGGLVSQRYLGGGKVEFAWSVAGTGDGGLIVGSSSNFSDPLEDDLFLMRLDDAGEILWQRSIGGPWEDMLKAVIESGSGGYWAAGEGQTSDTDPESDDWDVYDIWIAKLDGQGQITAPCGFLKDTDAYWLEADLLTAASQARVRDAGTVVHASEAQASPTDAAPVFLCPE